MAGMEYTILVEEGDAVKAVTRFNKEVEAAEKGLERTGKAGTQALAQLEQKAGSAGTAFKNTFSSLGGLGNFGSVAKQLEDIADKGEAAVSTLGGLGTGSAVAAASLAALVAGAGAVSAVLVGLVIAEADAAGATADLADRIGSTITQAQKFRDIAQLTGVQVGTLEGAAGRLNEVLDQGGTISKKAAEALQRLGVSTHEFTGAMRDSGTVLLEALNRLSRVEQASERLRLAQDLLGKGTARALAPAIKDFETFEKIIKDLGGSLDESLIKRLDDTGQKVDNLKKAWDNLKATFADKVNPIVIPIIAAVTDVIANGRQLVSGGPPGLTPRTDISGQQFVAPPSLLTFADDPARLAAKWRASRANDPDVMRQTLADLRSKRDRLDAGLSSGDLFADAARTWRGDFEQTQAEIARIEAALKKQPKEKVDNQWYRRLQALISGGPRPQRTSLAGVGDLAAIEFGGLDPTGERAARFQQENIKAVEDAAKRVQDAQLASQLESLGKSKDIQIAALDEITARTLAEKLKLEAKKLEIELEYIKKAEELQLKRTGLEEGDRALIQARLDAIRAAAADAEGLAKAKAAADQAKVVRAEMERTWSSIKDGAGRLFDTLISDTRNFGQVLGATLKTAILTPFRELLSTGIANLLAPVFGGMRGGGGFSGGGGGGGISGLFGALGGGGGLGSIFTGGFGGGPGAGGILGSGGGLSSRLLGGSGSTLGGLALGGSALGLMGAFRLGQSGNNFARSLAVPAGVASGLFGFGALSALFPSLIATGPVGWIAAGAIGGAIGLISLFRKPAQQKAIEKAKQVYGVTVSAEIARAIVEAGKAMGGLDVAIHSAQVREMIELYAMATGQKIGPGSAVRPVNLVQSNGQIFQQAQSINGQQYVHQSPFVTYGGVAAQTLQPAVINVQLDGNATTTFWERQTLQVVGSQPVGTMARTIAPLEWSPRHAG